ncbi:MAG: HesA/MoeB/ThiF family protein [Thermoplasmata archaeon]|nr:HesA/MoeB/ThiF family protein [Thermoplasmata archaeon]
MGRLDRQLPVFGEEGQRRISEAVVGIVGCGGLGTSVATALAVAGVRGFVISDPDVPEETNLNRQYVYAGHVGRGDEPRPKAEILAEWIRLQSPGAEVQHHVCRFDDSTSRLYDGCDVLVDCLDSIRSRMDLNRYSVKTGKPLVHGGINAYTGEIAVSIPGRTPCLRCMMGEVPESERPPASVGAIVAMVGSMEAAEVLKIISGIGTGAEAPFLYIDMRDWRFSPIRFERDPDCPVCGRSGKN